jgi:hypothetical protein
MVTYVTKTQKVMAMKAEGLGYDEIARKLNTTPASVRGIASKINRGKAGKWHPHRPFGRAPLAMCRQVSTRIDPEFDHIIQEEANRRGLSLSALCTVLLNTICEDNLFAAVLDTEGAE